MLLQGAPQALAADLLPMAPAQPIWLLFVAVLFPQSNITAAKCNAPGESSYNLVIAQNSSVLFMHHAFCCVASCNTNSTHPKTDVCPRMCTQNAQALKVLNTLTIEGLNNPGSASIAMFSGLLEDLGGSSLAVLAEPFRNPELTCLDRFKLQTAEK